MDKDKVIVYDVVHTDGSFKDKVIVYDVVHTDGSFMVVGITDEECLVKIAHMMVANGWQDKAGITRLGIAEVA